MTGVFEIEDYDPETDVFNVRILSSDRVYISLDIKLADLLELVSAANYCLVGINRNLREQLQKTKKDQGH